MAQLAVYRLSFDEFTDLNLDGRYELVNGQLEELVAPRPMHGRAGGQIYHELGIYLDQHEPNSFTAVELDIPTAPFYGRRPDYAYYSATDAARGIDRKNNRVIGLPTLVVEVLSPEDERRDLVTKREEYATAGIAHYWILDPERLTALTLELRAGAYFESGLFSADDVLTSPLFPGLELPLRRLFR